MKIVVCAKRVVDTEARVRVGADGRSPDVAGAQFILAPYDEIALEKAIQLRDQGVAAGVEGSVTVLTIGPAEASKDLRGALAMGADAALHAVAEPPRDPVATAEMLAAALAGRGADLVLLGKQATDEDDAAVGPLLAVRLGWPCVTWVDAVELEGTPATATRLRVRREVDGEAEVLSVALPCVLTAQKGLAEPRLPGLKGIMAAKKKPLDVVPVPVPASLTDVVRLSLPPARGALTSIPPTAEGMRQLLTALRQERKVL